MSAAPGSRQQVLDAHGQLLGAASLYVYFVADEQAHRWFVGEVKSGELSIDVDWTPVAKAMVTPRRWRLALIDGAGQLWRTPLREAADHDLASALAQLGRLQSGVPQILQLPEVRTRELALRDLPGELQTGLRARVQPYLDSGSFPLAFEFESLQSLDGSPEDGVLDFPDTPGELLLLVDHYTAASGFPGKWVAHNAVVLPASASEFRARWQLSAARDLQLKLRTPSGQPAIQVWVQVNQDGRDRTSGFTDAQGHFQWRIPPEQLRQISLEGQALDAGQVERLLAEGSLEVRWTGPLRDVEQLAPPQFELSAVLPALLQVRITPSNNARLFRLPETGVPVRLIRSRNWPQGGYLLPMTAGETAQFQSQAKPGADGAFKLGSGLSAIQTIRMPPAPVLRPEAPGALQAQVISPYALKLRWSDQSTREYGFELLACETADACVRLALLDHDSTEFEVHNRVPGKWLTYRLHAFNPAGVSDSIETTFATPVDAQFQAALADWDARHPQTSGEGDPQAASGLQYSVVPTEVELGDLVDACLSKAQLSSEPQTSLGPLRFSGKQTLDDGREVEVYAIIDQDSQCDGNCPQLVFAREDGSDCLKVQGELLVSTDSRPELRWGWPPGTGGQPMQLFLGDDPNPIDEYSLCRAKFGADLTKLQPPFQLIENLDVQALCQYDPQWD